MRNESLKLIPHSLNWIYGMMKMRNGENDANERLMKYEQITTLEMKELKC